MKDSAQYGDARVILPVFAPKKRPREHVHIACFAPPCLFFPRSSLLNQNHDPGLGDVSPQCLENVPSEETGCPGDQIGGWACTHDTIRWRRADGTHAHALR